MTVQAENGKHYRTRGAIFSSREALPVILATIRHAAEAIDQCGRSALDVIINGNPGFAAEIKTALSDPGFDLPENVDILFWETAYGDKANAWNLYIHDIRPKADICFFFDGYVRVNPDVCARAMETLAAHPDRLLVSGAPVSGRSAPGKTGGVLVDGGFHGNFFAIPQPVIRRLQEAAFHLPLGIYRNDSTIGAALAFDLDPTANDWNIRKMLTHTGINWRFDPLSWKRPGDLRTHFRRRMRQARGRFENAAVRQLFAIDRKPVSALPETAEILIRDWCRRFPGQAAMIVLKDPLALFPLIDLWRGRLAVDMEKAAANPLRRID